MKIKRLIFILIGVAFLNICPGNPTVFLSGIDNLSLRRVRDTNSPAGRIASAIEGLETRLRDAILSGNKAEIDKVVNEINAYKVNADSLVAGDVNSLSDFSTATEYQQYRAKVTDIVLNGGYVAEVFAAGAATRFGAGPFYGMDFWQAAERLQQQRAATVSLLNSHLDGTILMTDTQKKEIYTALSALTPAEQKSVADVLKAAGILTDKQKIDDLNNSDRLNALVSNTEALRSILGLIETAQPIEVMEDGIRGIGMGGRQLIQLRVELTKLSRENGTNIEDVMAKQMIVFHINSEAEETMKEDLLEHDFYGFNPENIVIIVQPVLPGYDINAEGKPVKIGDSESFPYGHGYATEQLISAGDAYTLDRAGSKTVLQGSALDYVIGKGAQLMGTHRINDLTRYVNNKDIPEGSNISALDLDKLALSLYLIEQQGSNVVVELVSNPDDQKGGLFLKDSDTGKQFLLETINAQTAELQARLKNTLVGIPYNAFRLVYNLGQLSNLLSQQLPNTIRVRGRTNSLYPELVTGDITQSADANSMGIQNVGELIHDFKTPGNLQEGIEYIRYQDLDSDFREIARQLGFTVP